MRLLLPHFLNAAASNVSLQLIKAFAFFLAVTELHDSAEGQTCSETAYNLCVALFVTGMMVKWK